LAFKKLNKHKQQMELVSLIDMIFILLVFFLVTSFVIRMPLQERKLYLPTPQNKLGRAQILIQFVDEDQCFWLDETASDVVTKIEENFGYLSNERLRDKILAQLTSEHIIPYSELIVKLQDLKEEANNNPSRKYFILIRCPYEMEFFRVIYVIEILTNTQFGNVQYGCVGGSYDDIIQCKQITNVIEVDANGKRTKNVRIDF